MFYCYILRNTDVKYKDCTYNGYTVSPFNRIRQHNGEITGGAKYTRGKGKWEIYMLMTGFVDNHNALSCEWKIKYPTNKRRPAMYCGVEGRIKSLNVVLPLKKWTKQCTVENDQCNYIIYIVNDMIHLLDLDKIPKYITVIGVDKITKESIMLANQSYCAENKSSS